MQATISDVAHRAGVSERTVSRVINDSPKVNDRTRSRVLKVIETLNYVPSLRARALASNRSSLIGLVHDDPNAVVLDLAQRGIFSVCAERGYELIVHPCHFTSPKLVDDVLAFARRSRVDGLVLLPPVTEHKELSAALHESGIPTVGIASVRYKTFGFMLVSKERAASAAMAEHLVGLGHKHFSMIVGPRQYRSAIEREVGFTKALESHGLALHPDDVLEGDYSFASGVKCGEKLLATRKPTAIFACNDRMAAGVLKAAAQRGVRIPQDLSVAGFDDSEIASMVTPSLTTIRRPFKNMAEEAARWLTQESATSPKRKLEAHMAFDLLIVERESSGPVPIR